MQNLRKLALHESFLRKVLKNVLHQSKKDVRFGKRAHTREGEAQGTRGAVLRSWGAGRVAAQRAARRPQDGRPQERLVSKEELTEMLLLWKVWRGGLPL